MTVAGPPTRMEQAPPGQSPHRSAPLFKKALVPLDGSNEAETVLPYLSHVARRLDTELLLISVLDSTDSLGPGAEVAVDPVTADTRARDYIRRLIGRLSEDGVDAKAWVSSGEPAEQIVGVAEHHGCNLIAMATHGRTVLGRGILGPVTDKVVHSATIPVMTIQPEAARERVPDRPISRIVVPLDGSELAETALPHVEALAQAMSVEVLLVVANPTLPSVRSAARIHQIVQDLRLGVERSYLVINELNAGRSSEMGPQVKEQVAALAEAGLPLLGEVPYDEDIMHCGVNGEGILDLNAENTALTTVGRLLEELAV